MPYLNSAIETEVSLQMVKADAARRKFEAMSEDSDMFSLFQAIEYIVDQILAGSSDPVPDRVLGLIEPVVEATYLEALAAGELPMILIQPWDTLHLLLKDARANGGVLPSLER